MTIQLYNTLTRKKEVFKPQDSNRVTMYVCGPTVYNYAHIGNARPAVVFDVLYRLLQHDYQNVVYARNITDVDDKINKAAHEQGVPISEITTRFTKAYHDDMGALSVLPPTVEPRVTEHMPQIIAMIQKLLDSGHAYEAERHVLFNVGSFPGYGKLSHRNREEMVAGARVEVAPYKNDPADFVLWKPSSHKQPGWDSPWGFGRPGWHLECSAMIEAHLGETIDIHGGGQDLIFPHHENEIAQGTCAHNGKLYCRYWMHNGYLNVDQQKMSKSLGNVLLVRDLLRQAPAEAVRLALLCGHYRSPLNWSADTLTQSKHTLDRLYRALEALEPITVDPKEIKAPQAFLDVLRDDLNTPEALAHMHRIASEVQKAQTPEQKAALKGQLLGSAKLIGLLNSTPRDWFRWGSDQSIQEDQINKLLHERNEARKNRQYGRADEIRDELAAKGIGIEDSPTGTKWYRL